MAKGLRERGKEQAAFDVLTDMLTSPLMKSMQQWRRFRRMRHVARMIRQAPAPAVTAAQISKKRTIVDHMQRRWGHERETRTTGHRCLEFDTSAGGELRMKYKFRHWRHRTHAATIASIPAILLLRPAPPNKSMTNARSLFDRAFALPSLDQSWQTSTWTVATVQSTFVQHLDRAPMLRVESWSHAFAADLAVEAAKEHVAILRPCKMTLRRL